MRERKRLRKRGEDGIKSERVSDRETDRNDRNEHIDLNITGTERCIKIYILADRENKRESCSYRYKETQ